MTHTPLRTTALATALAVACARPEARPDARADAPATSAAPAAAPGGTADSIALERGACYGSCPIYRVVIDAGGRVTFASQGGGRDSVTRGTADGAAGAVAALARRAQEGGFFELPDEVMADRALCRDRATDFPTVTVTVYRAAGVKRVVDYRGCAPDPAAAARLERLRALQTAVDSAAGSSRWARPRDRS